MGDRLSALKQSIVVGTDALDMDVNHLLVDGLILKGDRLVLGDVAEHLHRLAVFRHGVAVDAGRGDRQTLAIHHLVAGHIVVHRKRLSGSFGNILQLDGHSMHIGYILEHDLGLIRRLCAGGGDRLILIGVSRIVLVAIGRGGSLDELRLVLDTGHLIGADELVAVGAVHQLDQNIGIVVVVLFVQEYDLLPIARIVGDKNRLAGRALHLIARDVGGGDGDGLAGGDVLVGGCVIQQAHTTCGTYIRLNRDGLDLCLVGIGHSDVRAGVALGARNAVGGFVRQFVVIEPRGILRALVGGLPLHQRTAGEGAQIALDTCAVHIDRLVDQIARSLFILESDLLVGLAGREVLGVLPAHRLIADEVGGGDGGLLADLILHHLIGVVRDGVAIGVRRLDGDFRHVPIVVEHHDLVAVGQIDIVLRRWIGGIETSRTGIGFQVILKAVFVVGVIQLSAGGACRLHNLPLLPRPAIDGLLQVSVLGVAGGGVIPQLHIGLSRALSHAHNIDRGGRGVDRAVGRADGDVRVDIVHNDDGLAVAVHITGVQMLLLDGDLGLVLAVRFCGLIGRPADVFVIRVLYGVALLDHRIVADLNGVRHGQLFAVDFKASVGTECGGEGVSIPRLVTVRPGCAGRGVFVHLIPAKINLLVSLLGGVGDGFAVAVVHGHALARIGDDDAGLAAVLREDGAGRIIRDQLILCCGRDLIPAGDLRSGLVHRTAQRQDIIRVLGGDGDSAGFITQVHLAGFGDVQIDTGSVGVDFAAVILAALLVSEGGLLKQQLIAGGGEFGVGFRQQGNGVVLHRLLQRRVGGAVVSGRRSSSSLRGKSRCIRVDTGCRRYAVIHSTGKKIFREYIPHSLFGSCIPQVYI